jgi:hypothetical protein
MSRGAEDDRETSRGTLRAALTAADALENAEPEARAVAARGQTEQIETVWLPALADHIGATLQGRAPDGAPDAVRTGTAILQLAHGAGMGFPPRPAAAQALATARRHVRRRAEGVFETLSQALASPDAPDLNELSREMLRLEAMRFLAETLGDGKAEEEFAYISRRVARVALTRAAATIDAFLLERDLMRLFDNAAVLGRIDDVLTLALRVLDAKAAQEEQVTAFVEPADQTALNDFLRSLERLAEALLGLARRAALTGKGADAFFRGLLTQLGCILTFSRRLQHGERPPMLDALAVRIIGGLGTLADETAALVHEDASAVGRAEALFRGLEAMGLEAAAGPLQSSPGS